MFAPLNGRCHPVAQVIRFYSDSQTLDNDSCHGRKRKITINTKELVGRTFLYETEGDGHHFRPTYVSAVIAKNKQQDPHYTKSPCAANGDVSDKIQANFKILD
jgi:hypothetical protein